MFWYRDTLPSPQAGQPRVTVAFTDSAVDLQGRRAGFPVALDGLEDACGVRFARLNQVHGVDVVAVTEAGPPALEPIPTGDALVTATTGIGLMIRVADCVPVLLADVNAGVVGAAHAGRDGTRDDVVTHTVDRMRELAGPAAGEIIGWIGPHVCGRCYEVPETMRAEVSAAVPATYAVTRAGTPALDLGAGVRSQLDKAGVTAREVSGCTLEERRLHSYRRDGMASGRFAGLVWIA